MSTNRSLKRKKPHGYSEGEIWDMIERVAISEFNATGDFPHGKYAIGGKGATFDIKPDSGSIYRGKNKGRVTVYQNYNSLTGEYDIAGRMMCYTKPEVKITVEELCKLTHSPFPKDGVVKTLTAEEIAEKNRLYEARAKEQELEKHAGYRKVALGHARGAFISQLEYHRAQQHLIELQDPAYRKEVFQKIKSVNEHPYTRKKYMNNPEKALIIHPQDPTLQEMGKFMRENFVHPVLPDVMKGGHFKFSARQILDSIDEYQTWVKPSNRRDGVMVLPMNHAGDGTMLNMQFIALKPNNAGKDKFFISGATTNATALIFNESNLNKDTKHIFVTEGYATGDSLRQALNDPNKPVVVGWDKANIHHVMNELSTKYPAANLIFVTDNDFKNYYSATEKFDKNAKLIVENGGLKSVIEYVAKAPDSVRQRIGVLAPRIDFRDPNNIKITDFNDIHLRDGLAESRRILIDEMKQLMERRNNNVCEATYWKGYYNEQVEFFRNSLNEPRIQSLDLDIVKVNEPKPNQTPAPQKMSEIEKGISSTPKEVAQDATPEVKKQPTVASIVEMPAQSPINLRECNNALDLIKGISDEHLQRIKPKSILESGVIDDAPKPGAKQQRNYGYSTRKSVEEHAAPTAAAPKIEAEAPKAETVKTEAPTANNVYVNTTTVQTPNAPAEQPLISPALMTKLLVRSIEMQRAIQTIEALKTCEIPLHDKEEALTIASGTTYSKAQDLVLGALDPVMGPHVKEKLKETMENSRNLPVFKELEQVDNFLSVHTTVLAKEELDAIQLNHRLLSKAIGSIENKDAAIEGINEAVIESSVLRFDRKEKGQMYRSIVENFASIKDDSNWVKEVIHEFNKVKSAVEDKNKEKSNEQSFKQENRSSNDNQPSI